MEHQMNQALKKDLSSSEIREGIKSYPPMLQQYLETKERYPDKLLLFQVGDFYEVFFEDAVTVARTLNLTLTSRDKNRPDPIPMCGVPIAVVDGYLNRLVDVGFSVAVVSQVGEARPGKAMVERKLERIVTPAVRLLGGASPDLDMPNLLASIFIDSPVEVAIAIMNPQAGEIEVVEQISLINLSERLSQVGACEVLIQSHALGKKVDRRTGWFRELEQRLPGVTFSLREDSHSRVAGLDGAGRFSEIEGYLQLSECARKACRMLVGYLDEVTVSAEVGIQRVSLKDDSSIVKIDAMTSRNLELVRGIKSGGVEGSLYQHMNHTVTAGGSRLLRDWILRPVSSLAVIEERQKCVKSFVSEAVALERVRALLAQIADLERISARIELGVVQPRELSALRDSLRVIPDLSERVVELYRSSGGVASGLNLIASRLLIDHEKFELLKRAIIEEPSVSCRDGVVIDDDYDQELARLRSLSSSGRKWILELEKREREATGISSLKIKFNNVLGYFIEITRANLERVPEKYIRRQSVTSGERFVTEELKNQEEEILSAKEEQYKRQVLIFEELREALKSITIELRSLYRAIAELDVLSSFAFQAERGGLVCPEISEDTTLEYLEGKHPIIDSMLEGRFIANSLKMFYDKKNCFLVTGPNMGGKSTYLRQTGLIAIIAHLGAFVPAQSARIGLVDRIFARLGANDDLAEGQSTFMVEMKEAAAILMQASQRSLVLIDEIGRGTATADGLALAQSILEWLLKEANCRCLFATHYHELTQLETNHPRLGNLCVKSISQEGEVVFTHQIQEGAANRSYGIEVARQAGLPAQVIKRAALLLQERANGDSIGPQSVQQSQQLSFFNPAQEVKMIVPESLNQVRDLFKEHPLEFVRPIEALNLLDQIKGIIDSSEDSL